MTLETALLIALNNVHPLLLREEAAQMDANCLLPRPVTLTEARAALRQLEAGWLALAVTGESGQTLWKITARGRASLAERRAGL